MLKLSEQRRFMEEALRLAREGSQSGRGGPFGAVVVKDGQLVGRGCNEVLSANDPTAHAEITAIRAACAREGSHRLDGCALVSTCEPCPMCLGAIYWSRIEAVYFAATRLDAAAIGFDDALFHEEMAKPVGARRGPFVQVMRDAALVLMTEWASRAGRRLY
jgi:tRNA(Arg) A34 adenosine deaminase TadA